MKMCGDCEHFLRAMGYKFGECCAPLPAWAGDVSSPPVFGSDTRAEECDAYLPRGDVGGWLMREALDSLVELVSESDSPDGDDVVIERAINVIVKLRRQLGLEDR